MSEHKTTANFAKTGAFTVAFATEDTVVACDYVGVESGAKVPNKFEKAGFTAVKSSKVNAPIIQELPMSLECKVRCMREAILFDGQRRNTLRLQIIVQWNKRKTQHQIGPMP